MNRAPFARFRRADPSSIPLRVSRRRFFGLTAGGVLGSGLWTQAHNKGPAFVRPRRVSENDVMWTTEIPLRMEWRGTTFRRSHTDCVDAFRGDYFEDVATIEVIATTPPTPAQACGPSTPRHGFRFVSDPAHTSVSHFAQIGREHNGIFF